MKRSIHGLSRHKLYNVWHAIKNRCYVKSSKSYKNYGGRGIKISPLWENDFKSFIKYCVDNGWDNGLEIDRIDNDGDYEPGNIRFVSKKQNLRNTRQSKVWVINNKKYQSATSAAKHEGVSSVTIQTWCGVIKKSNGVKKCRPGCYVYSRY